jgi:Na+/glutamate symporter
LFGFLKITQSVDAFEVETPILVACAFIAIVLQLIKASADETKVSKSLQKSSGNVQKPE